MGCRQAWFKSRVTLKTSHLAILPLVMTFLAPTHLQEMSHPSVAMEMEGICTSVCSCTRSEDSTSILTAVCVDSNLTSIPNDLPFSLFSLDIHGNKISLLDTHLNSLTNLRILNLNNNIISVLQAGTFDSHMYLEVLDLSYNSINSIHPQTFENLTNILTLNLANNQLTNLNDGNLFRLQRLHLLNLSSNNISSISNKTFFYLHSLEILDLSHNYLQLLEPHIFEGLVSVSHIYLQYNNLHTVTGAFNGLLQLQILFLFHNSLLSLENGTFANLPSITILDMSFNNISNITPSFCSNTSLQTLNLRGNPISQLEGPVFNGLTNLQRLDISQMPYLESLSYDAFDGLFALTALNLSHNPCLSFLHPELLSLLSELAVLDLRSNNLYALSHITFHGNPNLVHMYLAGNPLLCGCNLAWLVHLNENNTNSILDDWSDVYCVTPSPNVSVPLPLVSQVMVQCNNVSIINFTGSISAKIGSQLVLQCEYESDETGALTWITPRGLKFHYHPFHPEATSHLLRKEDTSNISNSFHAKHDWHLSSSYNAGLHSSSDRILLQSDGSLYIDYILRSDAGPYKCIVHNSHHSASARTIVLLDYQVIFEVKIMSMLVGLGCAVTFFMLNAIYVVIMWIACHLINKRRREVIHNLLESLDEYRTTQVTRIRTNYSHQLSRIRDHYHTQSLRLRENYATQMKRVRRGCSNQVEWIRDNYHSHMTHLKDKSSHQIHQIREATNSQITRIRDYGLLQMERIRETYKLQQQHVIKVLEAMNLENCRTVVETECMRTQSMIFDSHLFSDLDEETSFELSYQGSPSESTYATAFNSDDSSIDSLANVVNAHQAYEMDTHGPPDRYNGRAGTETIVQIVSRTENYSDDSQSVNENSDERNKSESTV